jgi:catechol 2,3-dioxygenase-like lactoylglutathione lyase family enzyme
MKFDHVAMQVPNITEAVSWYQQNFPKCEVLYHDDTWAFLEVHGTKLAFVKEDDHPAHIAWRVDEETLQALSKKLDRKIKTHRDKTRSFYFQGPGDQWIEMITYPKGR